LPSKLIFHRKGNISLGGFFQFSPGLIKEIYKQKPDIIFENPYLTLTPRSYMSYIASILFGIPIVYIDAGDIIPIKLKHKISAFFESPVVRHVSRIITYNEAGKKRFIKKYGADPARIHVIPKPIDTAEFSPDIDGSAIRREYGLEGKFVVAYYGRLCRNKGCEYLLHAAAKILSSGKNKDTIFLFAGGNIVPEHAAHFRDILEGYHLENVRVTRSIPHDRMPEFHAACDLVVYPDVTNLPGFSTVLAESMSAGKPIIIGIKGDEDAIPLKHEETGIIVRPRDVDEIAEEILRLKQDSRLRSALAENVRRFAEEHMAYEKVADSYLHIFQDVLRSKKSS